MGIAKKRWRHPGGHVLPVMVAPTPKEAIPAYLRAVTILEPRGDVVAKPSLRSTRSDSAASRTHAPCSPRHLLAGALAVAGYLRWQNSARTKHR
jgi:hypothetical protein